MNDDLSTMNKVMHWECKTCTKYLVKSGCDAAMSPMAIVVSNILMIVMDCSGAVHKTFAKYLQTTENGYSKVGHHTDLHVP